MTEKREDMVCEICGHPMTADEEMRVFTCGPFDYHAKALMYHCGCCGYEKLGTCMVQFWENDTPPEEVTEDQVGIAIIGEEDIEPKNDSDPEHEDPIRGKRSFWTKVCEYFKSRPREIEDSAEIVIVDDTAEQPEAEEHSEEPKEIEGPEVTTEPKSETKTAEVKEAEKSKEDSKTDQPSESTEKGKEKDEKEPEAAPEPVKETSTPAENPDAAECVQKPVMFETKNGKRRVTNEWMDWMLEHSVWYPLWYRCFVPKKRKKEHKEEHYLSSHIPVYQAIRNDILYDTKTAKMYLALDKTMDKGRRKIYYYVTPGKKYFSMTVMMGRADELMVMEEKDVKKLLSEYPDLYREIVNENIIE